MTGAIQIAGTDATTQLPFFVVACDYTLIGEELYAASAYLSREPLAVGALKGQDWGKFVFMVFLVVGTVLALVAGVDVGRVLEHLGALITGGGGASDARKATPGPADLHGDHRLHRPASCRTRLGRRLQRVPAERSS